MALYLTAVFARSLTLSCTPRTAGRASAVLAVSAHPVWAA